MITSVGFGVGSIIIMEYLIPLFEQIYVKIPNNIAIALAVVLLAIHSSDFTLTVSGLTNFQKNIAEMEDVFQNRMTLTVDKIFERSSRYPTTSVGVDGAWHVVALKSARIQRCSWK